MRVLGIAGGIEHIDQCNMPEFVGHDAAAVLIEDGRIVAGIEEERLNRIKHTNKAPLRAIRFCLDYRNITLDEVDYLAFYGSEEFFREWQPRDFSLRKALGELFAATFRVTIPDSKIVFVEHHMAHGVSAFGQSGFDNSLVVTIDGAGDGLAGMVMEGTGSDLTVIERIPQDLSLGFFYLTITETLGFKLFDEYKVMGLAPYGDPATFRDMFGQICRLLPKGRYELHRPSWATLLALGLPRSEKEPIAQIHMDMAAALQERLETTTLHMLTHYRDLTGQRNLCVSGGVAHNCSLNGKIIDSRLFERVFVHPAAHDAGGAVGAALYVSHQHGCKTQPRNLKNVYWGTKVTTASSIEKILNKWNRLITFERIRGITNRAADLLANGSIIGWVHGRSEFGPRALGNRCILADPRPAANKDIINAMVKKRESFRPFAPSVAEEQLRDFFCISETVTNLNFMNVVVHVQPHQRQHLGAVTHVDGTARVHVVSHSTNKQFWKLLCAFGRITGIPILLNTSFNNNSEPIVDSELDAITCFLTTTLDWLVIGDYLVRRASNTANVYDDLYMALPGYVILHQRRRPTRTGEVINEFSVEHSCTNHSLSISPKCFTLLSDLNNGGSRVGYLLRELDPSDQSAVLEEVLELWARRLVILTPDRYLS